MRDVIETFDLNDQSGTQTHVYVTVCHFKQYMGGVWSQDAGTMADASNEWKAFEYAYKMNLSRKCVAKEYR